ncbi:GTP-binding protein [uncultured Paludibaculum sp.]|uniref:GTP-binding protein n=1 Tax=uncultured Paludibaculum sp. TaxID=1765020 RepID=UPI002AAC0253|nr:GTP-binding protein [uncultured Paludibaculum sp.]
MQPNINTRPTLVLVGGFLGAGKTTLLLKAAEVLEGSGLRCALITNDQGGALVDTEFAQTKGLRTGEVTGGCFCCRLSDLVEAAAALAAHQPDVIFAEPVGSCIDISATILQPLKAYYSDQFHLAPFTVLADPEEYERMHAGDADPDLAYLYRHQLDEADLLCFSKADLCTAMPPGADYHLSAHTGEQVDAWLDAVLHQNRVAGAQTLQNVDYARYAEAEAALGWLNWRGDIRLARPLSPSLVAGPILDEIDAELTVAGIRIAHLKVLDRASTGYVKASLTRNGDEPGVDGDLTASFARDHTLTLNLRATGDPARMEEIVRTSVGRAGVWTNDHLQAFRPSPPKPERRMDHVVSVPGAGG